MAVSWKCTEMNKVEFREWGTCGSVGFKALDRCNTVFCISIFLCMCAQVVWTWFMDSSGLASFCVTYTCVCQTLSLTVVFLCPWISFATAEKHSILLFRWQMCFLVIITLCYLEPNYSQPVNMLGGLMLRIRALRLELTFFLVAVWPSQKEATVCFCGRARCLCGFRTVDIKPSHLRGTGCPAHVSVASLAGSPDFLPSAGALLHLWPCSLAFHLGEFLMLLFLFDSVLFMSSPVGVGRAISPPQRSISPCDVSWLAAAQQFWNTFYSGGKPVRMWREVLEDSHLRREESGQGCQWGEEITWEKLEIAGQKLRYIKGQMNVR